MPAQWPRRHLDVSWMMGLELARRAGLDFGSDIVFTYGPWGFLASPAGLDVGSQVASGLLRMLAVGLLFLALADSLRGWRWAALPASALTLLISNGGQPDWILMLAIMVWVLTCVTRSVEASLWSVSGVAAVAAFLFQLKFTVGLMTIALVGLLVISHRRRVAALLGAVASFVVAFVLLWLLAGQSLAAVPRWLRLGWEIIAGYSDAMGYYDTNVLMLLMVASLLVSLVVLACVRPLGWLARLGFVGSLLFFAKISLGLPDGGHLMPGYAGVLAVLAVLLGLRPPRPARWAAGATVLSLCVFLSAGSPVLAQRQMTTDGFHPAAWGEAHTDRLTEARTDLRRELGIDPIVLAALRDHPVSVDPWEISAVWAHDLEWSPLTVFQQYSAYTPTLDEANATALLADPDRRVLRERVADHDYNPVWVTPAYTMALACNFQAVATDGEWSALARVEDRCGEEQVVSKKRVAADEVASLPSASSALVAVRFEPDARSLPDRLLGIIGVQRHLLHATVDGETYRVTEALADGPLIVGAPSGEAVLFDLSAARGISFDRAGTLEVVEIPLTGRESE